MFWCRAKLISIFYDASTDNHLKVTQIIRNQILCKQILFFSKFFCMPLHGIENFKTINKGGSGHYTPLCEPIKHLRHRILWMILKPMTWSNPCHPPLGTIVDIDVHSKRFLFSFKHPIVFEKYKILDWQVDTRYTRKRQIYIAIMCLQ